MGSDKALVEVDGVPAALRVATTMAEVCRVDTASVVLVGGPLEWASRLGLGHLVDDAPGQGPLAAIDTALRRLGGDCLVVACDLLGVDAAALGAVLRAGGSPGCDVAVAVDPTGVRQPLLARWNASACPVVGASVAAGERSPTRLLDRLAVVEVECAPTAFVNVNDPEELRRFVDGLRTPGV
jgi:molybdopterin-guanine dinucleotide biosynthesis protein A